MNTPHKEGPVRTNRWFAPSVCRLGPHGFTLIELLVVIAIIALLVTILMPSLNRAKDLVRRSVCSVHLNGAAKKLITYASEYGGFLPGPNTTGFIYFKGGRPPDASTSAGMPMQWDDWMSPIFGESMGLPKDRNARLLKIFNMEFYCPANQHHYDYIYGSAAGWPDPEKIRYNSYSAPYALHAYTDAAHASKNQPGGFFLRGYDGGLVNMEPSGHKFRIDTLGDASLKVAAMDGARYVNDEGRISFNTDTGSNYGGNFMNRGPCLNPYYQNNGNPYKYDTDRKSLHPIAEQFSYRHIGTMSMVFLDGHGSPFDHEESRRIDFWFPSGSVVLDPSELGDPNVRRGDIVE